MTENDPTDLIELQSRRVGLRRGTDFSPVDCLFQTDAYKLSHVGMYKAMGDITRLYSNWTNRKSRMPGVEKVVHFGLQAYIQKLNDSFVPFFQASNYAVQTLYRERLSQILGQDVAERIGTEHIGQLHHLGYLPLRFCAVPEGTHVPIGVPSFTVENTHDFAWLTNYIEPGISASYWFPSTAATIAHEFRKVLDEAAIRTGASKEAVDYQCHDFSFRGIEDPAAAAKSGAAHLLSFAGTDSLSALPWIERYYGGHYVAQSVPATEHSVMSLGIALHGELETFRRLLQLHPTGTLAVVADTFDLWNVCTNILPALKDEIMSRDGKLVIRPDSGDPEKILCGTRENFIPFNSATQGTPEELGVVMMLDKVFGRGPESSNGFATLDPHVGVIYGDSITLDRAKSITSRLYQMGYASTTVTLGVGSYTYQYNTRDTFGSAMKATWAEVDGKGVNLFKDPVTDDGTKKSATGRLAVLGTYQDMRLEQDVTAGVEARSLLHEVWEDGKFIRKQTFEEVRQVLNEGG